LIFLIYICFNFKEIQSGYDQESKYIYDNMDTQGKIMKSGSLAGQDQTILDIALLPKGVYFLHILNDEPSLGVHKVVKQ